MKRWMDGQIRGVLIMSGSVGEGMENNWMHSSVDRSEQIDG